jgi:cytidine deaminase
MAMDTDALLKAAHKVRLNAHARYSNYFVGAALVDDKGNLHVGCNVENSAYPEGSCAEAVAIGSMVASGGTRIGTIAIVGGPGDSGACAVAGDSGNVGPCTPCGGCRQRIREFADAATRIILVNDDGVSGSYSIDDLLPMSFGVE